MKATWNGAVLAESDRTVVVEGNHYFPPDSIRKEHLLPSDTHTVCGWKGTANYYTIEVGGERNPDAAARAANSATSYLYEFSVWIDSPARNSNVTGPIRTRCSEALTRCISTREWDRS